MSIPDGTGTCAKVGYPSKAEATADAHKMRCDARHRGNHIKGHPMRPYHCPFCNDWHLTSLSRAKDKKMRQNRKTKDARRAAFNAAYEAAQRGRSKPS